MLSFLEPPPPSPCSDDDHPYLKYNHDASPVYFYPLAPRPRRRPCLFSPRRLRYECMYFSPPPLDHFHPPPPPPQWLGPPPAPAPPIIIHHHYPVFIPVPPPYYHHHRHHHYQDDEKTTLEEEDDGGPVVVSLPSTPAHSPTMITANGER